MFSQYSWKKGQQNAVLLHCNALYPPRSKDGKDFIIFAQEDTKIPNNSVGVLIPTDCFIIFKHYHAYTLKFPLKGTKYETLLLPNCIAANTLDQLTSHYIAVSNPSDAEIVVKAGDPIARLTLDCASEFAAVNSDSDSLSQRVGEVGPVAYLEPPTCYYERQYCDIMIYRRVEMPSFEIDKSMQSLTACISEKVLELKIEFDKLVHPPQWISASDFIICAQKSSMISSGHWCIDIGGLKIDTCEPMVLEWPVYGTQLATKSAVRRKALYRGTAFKALHIEFNTIPDETFCINDGYPIARVYSPIRKSHSSACFNNTLYFFGEGAAMQSLKRWPNLTFDS